jgi:hypothetical protein
VPDTFAAPASAGLPAGRYGSRPPRSGRVAMVIVIGMAFALGVAWVTWAGWHHANPPVRAQLTAYTVLPGDGIKIRISVRKRPERAAECTLRARNEAGREVARKTVSLPAGRARASVEEHLRTTERPVGGEVRDCRLLPL